MKFMQRRARGKSQIHENAASITTAIKIGIMTQRNRSCLELYLQFARLQLI